MIMSKLKIQDYQIIAEDEKKYLSFPDIIQSVYNSDKFFIVYREADYHHPTYSSLHFLKSTDKGLTWKCSKKWKLSMKENGYVWNCPRLCYLPDGSLNIVCDTKSSRDERTAEFKIFILKSFNDGTTFEKVCKTEMRGMVPDKIISFKKNLFCANHVVDLENETLTQLVNGSRDGGKTWYDCHIVARNKQYRFCEASVINFKNKYLLAYLRDNRYDLSAEGKMIPRFIQKFASKDGIHWRPWGSFHIYGHRITCLYEDNRLFASLRNTKHIGITLVTAELDDIAQEKKKSFIQIEDESYDNLFHCGYTGLVKNENELMVVYYIKKDKPNPFIKLCRLTYK